MAAALHCHVASLLTLILLHTTEPECPAQRMPVWIRFLHPAVIFWRRINSPRQSRVTNWLSMGQIWPSEVVYLAHTFHDKHYCLLFYSQPDTNLYIACLAAFVLAILILVLGLIREAPFFDSCTMGLPTGHFQKMHSGSQNSFLEKGTISFSPQRSVPGTQQLSHSIS